MKGSWKLGRLFGIDVYIHWTFLILIFWVIGVYWFQGGGVPEILKGIGFVLALFACVLAHEFGHSLTALRFGIRTPDITLLPIGGVSRMETIPEDPWQELAVTVAGPLVNVVIAVVLFVALYAAGGWPEVLNWGMPGGGFFATLMLANVILVVFNLLPAFPMDGGRVLRALLAYAMDRARATAIAARVGQFMAILFGIAGAFWFNPFLLFIALFVYLGAQQESREAQVRALLRGVPVRAAMMTRFRTLSQDDRLPVVLDELLAGYQHDFPVVDQGRVVGVLTRNDLLAALAQQGQDARVGSVMHPVCTAVDENDMLESTFHRMQEDRCPAIPVLSQGRLVGLINLENIGEWMMIQSALRSDHPHGAAQDIGSAA